MDALIYNLVPTFQFIIYLVFVLIISNFGISFQLLAEATHRFKVDFDKVLSSTFTNMCGKVLSVVKGTKMTAAAAKLVQHVDGIVDEDQRKR